MTAAPGPAGVPEREADLAARWEAGVPGPLRLADGRRLAIIFPGVRGGGAGPDFVGAILDAGGDILRGAVELHLHASGWRVHGHAADSAYAGVVLHVVRENDTAALATAHATGRVIPLLVLPPAAASAALPGFVPPCALQRRHPEDRTAALSRLAARRLRAKAQRARGIAPQPGQALYALLLETLGGSANRASFVSLARMLPLAALLERADSSPSPRTLALAAELKGVAARLVLRRAGLRPMASPTRRLDAAAALVARLWPAASAPGWPPTLSPAAGARALQAPGVGRAMATELMVNAVLPAAVGFGLCPEPAAIDALETLRSPGTYGKLRRLEAWLGGPGERPFATTAALQGGLALHADYCTRGMCGRCPLSQ